MARAFPQDEMREQVQALEAPNLFFVNGRGGVRDKNVRQKRRDGGGFVAASSDPSNVASSFHASLQKVFTKALLKGVDAKLEELSSETTGRCFSSGSP